MGLLDGLLGSMMGGQQGAQAQGGGQIMQVVLQMLQQNGGIGGLMSKMQQAGFGDQAQSWVGTGKNMPIPADALSQIFGQGQLGQIAQQMGMSHQEVQGGLAQMLPDVVDKMTPQGQIPANGDDMVAQALAMLQNKR